ncbi:MAG TPA: class I SAM-dependent RNA methyltransferase [Spirochaetota bacterium]|nr:class I SAM-dependent RNA methyltransferase [Spirochaetota bacterium]
MPYLNLIATSAFGLESIVVHELKKIGIEKTEVENGRINFQGDYASVVKSNLWLRCADRVLIKLAEFRAYDFEQLYQGALAVEWENFIPVNGKMHVIGKAVNSKLHSVPDCQAIVKKAIVESMKRKFKQDWFDESGPAYRIEISLLKDMATLTLDTSGAGLHKRGYRESQGEAPLKETLAAGLINISRWKPDRIFADPLCGSGTIPIEAALIGKNIAPGLIRSFSSEDWPEIPSSLWKLHRDEAEDLINKNPLEIFASDIDKRVFDAAVSNAEKARVGDSIIFQKKPVSEFSSSKKYGCIVCNPPYGERLQNAKEVHELYMEMGKVFSKLDSWSYFIMTSNENFEKSFGRKADKNRKLYNGKIKTYLYQYMGSLPGRN